ncbi:MAG: histidine phosphatase family protein [Verrucomicrobia bacterium]|nr:histidine phosphatase family protein [Cytophagales bacterium]
MESKTIYLIRHGQTDFNKQGIVQGGGVDSDLNPTGINQAQAFFEAYQHILFDKVYTSSLKRTHQSVKSFLDKGIAWEILPGLNEISWGHREGMKITPEEDVYYHWVLDQWRIGNDTLRIDGGESPADVQARQIPALQHITAQESEKNILVCMHGRAMRVLLCTMLNYPLYKMDEFEHQNLCLYKIHFTGNLYRIELFNDTNHLINSQVLN